MHSHQLRQQTTATTTTPKINSKLKPQTQNSLTASPYTTFAAQSFSEQDDEIRMAMLYLLTTHKRPIATTAMNRLADPAVRLPSCLGIFRTGAILGHKRARGFKIKRSLHMEVNKLIGSLSLGLMRTARLSLRLILNLWMSCCTIGPLCMIKGRELKVNDREDGQELRTISFCMTIIIAKWLEHNYIIYTPNTPNPALPIKNPPIVRYI